MSAKAAKKALSLGDFASLFAAVAGDGNEAIVIGGCAVGAYAHLICEHVLSDDLDLLASQRMLDAIVEGLRARGAAVHAIPQPRSVPVAFLTWEGKEVNILTATVGMPAASTEARVAREFYLPALPDLAILVADPYDLLRNKVSVRRDKDLPHIGVLTRFLEEEVVEAFEREVDPRKRIGPAQRLLDATRARLLDEQLAARLVPLARVPADFRFLMNHVPTHALADSLIGSAPEAERDGLRAIRRRRRLRRG